MLKIHHTEDPVVHVWIMDCLDGSNDWYKMEEDFLAAFDWVDTDPNAASMLTPSVIRDPNVDETDIWDELILPLEQISQIIGPHFDPAKDQMILLQRYLSADFTKVALPGYKYCGSVVAKINPDYDPDDEDM